jgi:hypothetical protein
LDGNSRECHLHKERLLVPSKALHHKPKIVVQFGMEHLTCEKIRLTFVFFLFFMVYLFIYLFYSYYTQWMSVGTKY